MNQYPISQKVLCVDDERRLLDGIRRQLRKEFTIEIAESAQEGLQILASEGPFALVISDYNMPGTDGIQFLNQVYTLYPETVLVMLTGRAELDIAIEALHKGHISRFLNKPCPKEVLTQTINDALEQYRLIQAEKQLQAELEKSNHKLNELNNHLEDLVKIRTQALTTQYQYVSTLAQLESSSQIANALIKAVQTIAQTDDIALFLNQNDKAGVFLPHLDLAKKYKLLPISQEDQQQGIIAQCLHSKKTIFIDPDIELSVIDQKLFIGTARACIPLEADKRIIGLLSISTSNKVQLDKIQISTIQALSNTSATALMNHWHLEIQTESQDAIITALAKLSEHKDPETGAHLLRLKEYCALLCQCMARSGKYQNLVTPEFTKDLVRSSPLHDIGKVGIADVILRKPGKLTEDEFSIMKTHANIGGDTLRSVYDRYSSQSFIKCGMEVAYCHHEKWDGSGYPQGLRGEDIPLTARILTVADVYDALTTRRVYKPPFSREKAKEIIITGSGQHFDPDVVLAFIDNEPLFHNIAKSMADNT
ncbi:HD domain-containing phosphohydrolase [methanotrophic endosymbiont of Bathymodiolus puteoserpentis (Logatchev)]|jgi:response regulator RpfG family c-di-GMP phosphodiesterase|uniref:HD domain-containing phosphohydrolase n=1 Tax=methanotrophic endosymbiont of Bathymodiolus puteoserpentis (Logatchev) TaxID=343235 RepID=UPI0013CC9A51|nr:HD domain-containing phosphohydrolase [methanotrophic endosymbiont of Bathymodiolus puteoserpentis (Logatchev)]SHE23608.1 Response regulator [methanotrophic endosymbiont of Bathymodiolus puteoserpentis (Logatchev)]